MRLPASLGVLAFAAVACRGPSAAVARGPRTMHLEAVPQMSLCFTQGRASVSDDARATRVDDGAVRAVVAGDHSRSAELAFRYDGPSAEAAPLANGEIRRQIGLKLRAQDTCNVVYVMWHLEPASSIAVSVKHNPGASTHLACGDRGYDNLRPASSARPATVERGSRHVLRAELDGDALRVTADGVVVWQGKMPASAATFDGPAGFRTDNGSFEVEMRVPGGNSAAGACP